MDKPRKRTGRGRYRLEICLITDGTGDILLQASSFAGFEDWEDVDQLQELVVWANEQFKDRCRYGIGHGVYARHFCGHGFTHEDPNAAMAPTPNAGLISRVPIPTLQATGP